MRNEARREASSRYTSREARSVAEANGYINLRIKSSKAFPLSEVSAIEEIISKVKLMSSIQEQK